MPRQTNTNDCGVYVCKYVSALYRLRDREFSKENAAKIIAESSEFKFDEKNVALLREEMEEIVTLLAEVYQRNTSIGCKYGSKIF